MTTDTNGIILLNKSPGITSFRALGSIKKSLRDYNGKKVKLGHTGTLDSFAEGLLVLLSGRFTRLNPVFTAFDKSYEAEIVFGTETDTLDPSGKIIKTADIPVFSVIKDNISCFIGEIMQSPPIFSAVHVNGERAYKKALKGTITELPERKIRINSFDIIDWSSPVLKCRIDCSKGTYIRSIARDLGRACSSCAHLSVLKRLSVGPFRLSDSVHADSFDPGSDIIRWKEAFELLSASYPADFMTIEASKLGCSLIKNGTEITDSFFLKKPVTEGSYAVFSGNNFIAYINYDGKNYSYNFVG